MMNIWYDLIYLITKITCKLDKNKYKAIEKIIFSQNYTFYYAFMIYKNDKLYKVLYAKSNEDLAYTIAYIHDRYNTKIKKDLSDLNQEQLNYIMQYHERRLLK